MVREFLLLGKLQRFRLWWRAPATRKDRIMGVVVGAIGCFWIGVLGRIILGPLPVPVSTLGWWAAASVAIGGVLGVFFPKVVYWRLLSCLTNRWVLCPLPCRTTRNR